MRRDRIITVISAALAILFAIYAWYWDCHYWFLQPPYQDPALNPPSLWALGLITAAMVGGVVALWKDNVLLLAAGWAGFLIHYLIVCALLFSSSETRGFTTFQLSMFFFASPEFLVPLVGLLLILPRLLRRRG